ncbi:FecCD family ABC transporter permease [Micromonospora deserti]|uniref:Iron ABC transporter permease n=1 Tax=Micromonospora deserti TaxID=2070366 RepID=A0A2W2CM35_9ACTN|nr:iron chelate uptake ABC transporter family permease subunit [Micromonospora deserti]PZF89469.1 iron ABC transporter permease [Micromonospora deserti]
MRAPGVQQVAGRTTYRLARPSVSGVLRVRALVVGLVAAALALVTLSVSVSIGDYPVPLPDVVRALAGSGDPGTLLIVRELRLPRAVVALLVGAGLGMSGAILLALTRNPLASPDILGIAQGASAAVVAGVVLGFGSSLGTSGIALLGGLAAAAAIYLLAWRRGTTGYRIVLVGVAIAALCLAVTQYLLVRAQIFEAQRAVLWLIGSLDGRDWAHATPLAIALAVLVPTALATMRWLTLLGLGDDTARGLGVPVQTARLLLLLIGVGLAAFATAAAGPVGFVALLSPHIARRLAGVAGPPLLGSALVGSVIVLVSDVTARLLPGGQLPVGVVTAALGAPFLLILLARANRAGTGG